jgi:WhiB family transcriptional regulator, redox-sensing transcriptional regulator
MTTATALTRHAMTFASPTASNWRSHAACRNEDPELFFPLGLTGAALDQEDQAKAVCARCPARELCLGWALDTGQDIGVWGGLSEWERKDLLGVPKAAYRTAPDGTPAWQVIVQSRRSEYEALAGEGLSAWEIGRRMRTNAHTINRVREALDAEQKQAVSA